MGLLETREQELSRLYDRILEIVSDGHDSLPWVGGMEQRDKQGQLVRVEVMVALVEVEAAR